MEAQKSQKGADGIIMKRKIYQELFFISRFVSKTCNLNGRKVSPCIL